MQLVALRMPSSLRLSASTRMSAAKWSFAVANLLLTGVTLPCAPVLVATVEQRLFTATFFAASLLVDVALYKH